VSAKSKPKSTKGKPNSQVSPPAFSPESFYMLPTPNLASFDPEWKQFNDSWTDAATTSPDSPNQNAQNPRAKRNLDIESELSKQSLYKTELCRTFMETGACPYSAKCQFAHGRDELRPVKRHPKYKTEICRTFHTSGTCPYGNRCRFIHDPAERTVSPALTQMEADALELDIQRQLADLRLSLQTANSVTTPTPAAIPVTPNALASNPRATPRAEIQQPELESDDQERKKSRLPFFQKLLTKKH